MDEVVERVPLGVVGKVLFDDGTVTGRSVSPCPVDAQTMLPGSQFFGVQILYDACGRFGVDGVLFAFVAIRTVLEADDEFAVLLGNGCLTMQEKTSIIAVGGLDVVLLGVGFSDLEVDAMAVGRLEGVIAEVLGGLDVVLVRVGPVELDLLALIGDGVDAFLVATKRDEITFVVVAVEEVI